MKEKSKEYDNCQLEALDHPTDMVHISVHLLPPLKYERETLNTVRLTVIGV